MRRPCVVLLSVLFLASPLPAQDSAAPPRKPSSEEKEQALAILAEARGVLFPLRHRPESIVLLGRIAPLLASAGDSAGARDLVAALPSNQRLAVELEIVGAELRSGETSAALELAAGLPDENGKAAALLEVVQAQAAAKDFSAALRSATLIPPARVESVEALVAVAKEETQAGKSGEAAQLLERARAATDTLATPSQGEMNCGLSVLAEIASAQQELGESAEALKTLRLASERLSEADQNCRYGAISHLEDDRQRPEALQKETVQLLGQLVPDAQDKEEEDQGDLDGPPAESLKIPSEPGSEAEPSTLSPEEARHALDGLRSVKPLPTRALAAIGTSQMLVSKGKLGEAEEALHVGLEAADTVQDDNLRGALFAARAQVRTSAKDWDGARRALEEIPDETQRTSALENVAFSATQSGQAERALSWAKDEASPLSEARVLVSIVEALLHQPHPDTQSDGSYVRLRSM